MLGVRAVSPEISGRLDTDYHPYQAINVASELL